MTVVKLETLSPHDVARDRENDCVPLIVKTDPDELALLARDAGALQGSGAIGLVTPRSEGQLARWLLDNPTIHVLAQGALTSLTGGATPSGDVVVSTRQMTSLFIDKPRMCATVGAGLLLANLQERLADAELYYPPAPTHDGATLGGNVSTNAAGAATFKYGTTRDWVERVRVVLRHGDVLEVRRGEHALRQGDVLRIEGSRTIELPMPRYRSPNVKKSSVGYWVKDPWDPIDLFIGSEGTLGFITQADLRLVERPSVLTGLVFLDSVSKALRLVESLRRESLKTRGEHRPCGLDVRSIEYFDHRCLELLRSEDKLSKLGVDVPRDAKTCLLFEQELPRGSSDDSIVDRLVAVHDGARGDDAVGALMRVLLEHNAVERTELALPTDGRRRAQLAAVREAIPLTISDYLVQTQLRHPDVHKAAGDMIVPFDQFGSMLERYYEVFGAEGVDVAVFGHISDGNVHPNALPVGAADMDGARRALLALATEAKQLGGCPLSEHGVGKHPLKKRMLAQFWGGGAMEEMRAIKHAFDPNWTLGRGVFFDAPACVVGEEIGYPPGR